MSGQALYSLFIQFKRNLFRDVASWSDITPCNKRIDKALVVYRLLMLPNDAHYNTA